ncbi:PREDICTED: protein FAM170A-like [Galeopterus variegatus]|uniref:Protein FAM170A-like n=1 Tax=Galeopterus variegatus TaxID=482537 RepID=A0ABM0R1C7_GALVR|nr:PREDICTED: protein FAM170A-like [Galeopterus variegatus]
MSYHKAQVLQSSSKRRQNSRYLEEDTAGIIESDENTPQPGPSGLTQAHSQTAEDSDSKYLSSASFEDKLDHNESCKSQENAPEISVVVPAQAEIPLLLNICTVSPRPASSFLLMRMVREVQRNSTDSECSVDSKAQEEREEEADSSAEPAALEDSSRARTLEMLDSAFKCMACCGVYLSLEVLQVHVEHGVHEGFSCCTFHLALAQLKRKRNGKGKENKIKTTTSVCNREERMDVETSSCTSTD